MISHPKVVAVLLSTALVFLAFGDGHDLRPDRAAEPTGTCDSAGPERICHAAPAATENDQLVLMQKRISAESFVELATSTTEDKCKAEGAPCTYEWNGEKNLGDDECCSKKCDKHWNEEEMKSEFVCAAPGAALMQKRISATEDKCKAEGAACTWEWSDEEERNLGDDACCSKMCDKHWNPKAKNGEGDTEFVCVTPPKKAPPPKKGPPTQDCKGDPEAFDAGYGNCETYATDNFDFCGSDVDQETKDLAAEVCHQCGQCIGFAAPPQSPPKKAEEPATGSSGGLSCATSPFELAGGAQGKVGTCTGCLVPTWNGAGLPLCFYRNDQWAEDACQAEEGKVWCGGGAKTALAESGTDGKGRPADAKGVPVDFFQKRIPWRIVCKPEGSACTDEKNGKERKEHNECCSTKCEEKKCTGTPTECKKKRDPCLGDDECCSKTCTSKRRCK